MEFQPGKIETIKLDNNQIRSISSIFYAEENLHLKSLILRSNRILYVPECVFCNFPNLNLDFRFNLLKILNPGHFSPVMLFENSTESKLLLSNQRLMCSCELYDEWEQFLLGVANITIDCREDGGWRKQTALIGLVKTML